MLTDFQKILKECEEMLEDYKTQLTNNDPDLDKWYLIGRIHLLEHFIRRLKLSLKIAEWKAHENMINTKCLYTLRDEERN